MYIIHHTQKTWLRGLFFLFYIFLYLGYQHLFFSHLMKKLLLQKNNTGLSFVLGTGVSPNDPLDQYQNRLLHFAVTQGNRPAVEILLFFGADVSAQNIDGNTPLHSATNLVYLDLVRYLLNHGANPNIRNKYGQTPLHLASERGAFLTIEILLKAGANLFSQDIWGRNAIDMAFYTQSHYLFKTYMQYTPWECIPASTKSLYFVNYLSHLDMLKQQEQEEKEKQWKKENSSRRRKKRKRIRKEDFFSQKPTPDLYNHTYFLGIDYYIPESEYFYWKRREMESQYFSISGLGRELMNSCRIL